MNEIAWLIVMVAVIVIVAALAWRAGQQRRSQRLQERFGPEYDRTVETAGKRSAAEADLQARQERVEALEIRPLDGTDRDRFGERWRVVQALFVDDPASAVDHADVLIGDVMRARGYPVGDFEQRAADVSVNHPQVVDHYRAAHAIAAKQRAGTGDTEQLRQAMVHYRALFADLLDLSGEAAASSTPAREPDVAGTPVDEEPGAPAPPRSDATQPHPAQEPVATPSTTEGPSR